MGEKLNQGFSISKEEISDRIQYEVSFSEDYGLLVPLKEISSIDSLHPLSKNEIEAYLRAIPLAKDHSVKPYEDAEFYYYNVSPAGLYVPQKFILEEKILFLINSFDHLYDKFSFPGISQRPTHYACGEDKFGNKRTALYMQPMVEKNHIDLMVDGHHRSAICGGAGTTISVIGIKGSSVDPPYSGFKWELNMVKEKPAIDERYKNFKPSLFKDFDYVGIDG